MGMSSSPKGMAFPDARKGQVLSVIESLREDPRDEAALGDAALQTRNIAVADAAEELEKMASKNKAAAVFAIDNGAIQALASALSLRPNSEAVQWKATSALWQLLLGGPLSLPPDDAKLAVEVTVAALRAHPNSELVQEHAVGALGALVHSDQDNQTRARQAGGMEAVILALEHHKDSEGLQRNAAFALGGLVAGSADAQLRARRAQGVETLARTLERHVGSESVEERALEALGHLIAGSQDSQKVACDVGVVAVVVDVLKKHRMSKRVVVKAFAALNLLVVGNPAGQRLAGETGALAATLSALKAFSKTDDVMEQVFEALYNIVRESADNQRIAREVGVVQTMIQAVIGRQLSACLQARALAALGALLAGNAESQAVAREAGAVEVLLTGLRRATGADGDTAALQEATVALEHFAKGHAQNQDSAGRAGVIEALITVLRQHADCEHLQQRASRALTALVVDHQANTKAAVAAGGLEDVLSALRRAKQADGGAAQAAPAQPRRRSISPTRAAAAAVSAAAEAGGDGATERRPLTKKEEYQEQARQSGLIQAIIAALPQPPNPMWRPTRGEGDGPGLSTPQGRLLGVLADLVEGNYENQEVAAEAGGIEAALATMRAHAQSEEIQEQGVGALYKMLSEHAGSQRRGKALEAAEALRLAQDANPENATLMAAIAKALEALYSGEKFQERVADTAFGKRHATVMPIADTAMRGITLEQILELQDFMQESLRKHDLVDKSRGSTRWEDLTMYQVRDHFVKPLTQKNQCSLVELMSTAKQPPMWMISHWWGTPFPLTVRMLQLQARSRHSQTAALVSYWFDAFANNQWNMEEVDEADVLRFPFARAMLGQSCMGTVLLCDPEVTALLRTWCVFEAHVTQQLRCGALADRCDRKRYFLDILAPVISPKDEASERPDKVTITMLQDAIGGSWNEVSDTEGVFFPLGVAHVGVGVDVTQAEASEESDHRMILNFLTQGVACKDPPPSAHPKYDELNGFVHNVFASAELYRVASERRESCLQAAQALLQLRADVNSFVRQGQTALFAAAGADPGSAPESTSKGGTAQQRDLVELLLTARADVNHASADMKTVLDCSADLSDDARGLLIKHGAKTFIDAAPELERAANVRLAQILASGFATEQQAFVGGDAGTRLSAVAQRSLQETASILKLYHWAPCRIGMQTNHGMRQANLAIERAQNVKVALESAGCKNAIHVQCGPQAWLLTLVVSVAPPQAQTSNGDVRRRALSPMGSVVSSRPRSPVQAGLPQRTALARLPPVICGRSLQAMSGDPVGPGWRTPASSMAQAVSPKSPFPGRASLGLPAASGEYDVDLRPRTGSDPGVGGKGGQAWAMAPMGPPVGAAAVGGGILARPAGARGTQRHLPGHLAPVEGVVASRVGAPGLGGSPSHGGAGGASLWLRASGGLHPSTPPASYQSPGRMATDLDSLAGDRWYQTSITCSRSAPTLHHVPRTEPMVSEVKGLGSTTPFAGMENMSRVHSRRVGSSGRGSRRVGDKMGGGSPRHPFASKGSRQAHDAERPAASYGRPQGASGARPALLAGGQGGGGGLSDGAAASASTSADGDGTMGADGRPPTRAGQRPVRASTHATLEGTSPRYAGRAGDWGADISGARGHSLPSLSPQSAATFQRSGNRHFSVLDLID